MSPAWLTKFWSDPVVDSRQATSADDSPALLCDVLLAMAAFATAPIDLGGLWIRGWHGPRRDALINVLGRWASSPPRRINHNTDPAQLHEGMELADAIGSGTLVRRAGLLAELEGGILLLAMAERATQALLGPIAMALDERRLAMVALDESLPDEQGLLPAMAERLSLVIDLRDEASLWPVSSDLSRLPEARQWGARLAMARREWRQVRLDGDALREILKACAALGIDSMRAPLLASNLARVSASLHGRSSVEVDDLGFAIRLCLLPRARQMPVAEVADARADGDEGSEPQAQDAVPEPPSPRNEAPAARPESLAPEIPPPATPQPPDLPESADAPHGNPDEDTPRPLPDGASERLIEAALAALPPGVLALLAGSIAAQAGRGQGVSGAGLLGARGRGRGRPAGSVRRAPRSGERLHLLASIRAAVPFQPLRRQQAAVRERLGLSPGLTPDRIEQTGLQAGGQDGNRLHLRPDDLHVHREKRRRGNTTVFVVDASGSMALQRLSEAKGAVEVLLAECYVRRDRVALVSFRGKGADLLLTPTRSLVAARRSLTALPGGGGSPVASGLELAARLVAQVRRAGDNTTLVVLTDGRANLTRAGQPGRQQAGEEARQVARQLATLADRRLLIDTSVRPDPAARSLAEALHGVYLPMPFAQARAIGEAVTRAVAPPRG